MCNKALVTFLSGKQYHNVLNKIFYNTVYIEMKYLVICGTNLPYTVGLKFIKI